MDAIVTACKAAGYTTLSARCMHVHSVRPLFLTTPAERRCDDTRHVTRAFSVHSKHLVMALSLLSRRPLLLSHTHSCTHTLFLLASLPPLSLSFPSHTPHLSPSTIPPPSLRHSPILPSLLLYIPPSFPYTCLPPASSPIIITRFLAVLLHYCDVPWVTYACVGSTAWGTATPILYCIII